MSIRLRVALVFTLALAVAFAIGSWLFLSQLHSQLVASTLKAQLTPYVRVATGHGGTIAAPENVLVQVINRSGRIIRHSPEAGVAPMLSASQLRQARAGLFTGTGTNDGERVNLAAEPVGRAGLVLVVGSSGEDNVVKSTVQTSTIALVIGGIVFVVAGGAGAYWLAAAALSPVERMRRQVAALSVGDAAGGVQVPRTRDELAALAGTMNDLLARLHEALARQRGFVADASHELRTPLAVLGAELELAGRPGRSRDELAGAVANAEDEVARLTRLTNDLLLLARSDEGRVPLRPVPVDVGALLTRSVERFAGRAAASGVTCEVDVPAGLIAELDEDRIQQAVDNLIDNALRFAPQDSAVRVVGRVGGDRGAVDRAGDLVIEVTDGGPGFPTSFLPHAFERFKRPDSSRARSDGGAGLGLAIVAAIAAAHGGAATARNAPGGGAVVSIELPGAVSAAPGSAPSWSTASGAQAVEPGPPAAGPAR